MIRQRMRVRGGSSGDISDISSPADLPNLSLWWDMSDTSLITHSGGLVSQVSAKSGYGNNLTATLTARPTTNTRTINGLNTLDFNGTTNVLTMLSADRVVLRNSVNTVFCVAATDDSTTLEQGLFGVAGSGGRRWGIFIQPASSRYRMATGTADSLNIVTLDTNQHIVGYTQDTVDFKSYVDGSVGTTGITQFLGSDFSGQVGAISSASFFNGKFAELIVYNRVLSGAEISLVNSYLKQKWATP